MRLVSFLPSEGDATASGIRTFPRPRLGAVVGEDRILDFARADAGFAKVGMLDLVERAEELVPKANALLGMASELPREAFHEEMYYYRVSPADGFGLCHYYNSEGEEENFTIRDNSIGMMPRGYHTVVSAPGYSTYYMWFLAGNGRIQGSVDDPALGWVSKTVPMLKELGH